MQIAAFGHIFISGGQGKGAFRVMNHIMITYLLQVSINFLVYVIDSRKILVLHAFDLQIHVSKKTELCFPHMPTTRKQNFWPLHAYMRLNFEQVLACKEFTYILYFIPKVLNVQIFMFYYLLLLFQNL